MATDATLASIAAKTHALTLGIIELYDMIREAKETGYSYNELESVTKITRGTLQNIASGRNPRFSVENNGD